MLCFEQLSCIGIICKVRLITMMFRKINFSISNDFIYPYNFRYLLTGEYPQQPRFKQTGGNHDMFDVIRGSVFDGSIKQVIFGFPDDIMVNIERKKML